MTGQERSAIEMPYPSTKPNAALSQGIAFTGRGLTTSQGPMKRGFGPAGRPACAG